MTTAEGVTLTPTGFVDETADTEGQAFVRSVLSRVAEVIEGLPEITQWVPIHRYYEGMGGLPAVAEALGRDLDEITQHWKAGIFAAHNAMLMTTEAGCPCRDSCSCARPSPLARLA